MPKPKPQILSADLEHCILHAMVRGLVPLDAVTLDELSKPGRAVVKALGLLREKGAEPPHPLKVVVAAAADSYGGEAHELRAYLQKVEKAGAGKETLGLLQIVRDKQRLVEVINAAGSQLAAGSLDTGQLRALLEEGQLTKLEPIAELLKAGIPNPPRGFAIRDLPTVNEASGGVFGFWAIAGGPAVGKSTLALQIAASAAYGGQPVLYYDFENGEAILLNHLAQGVKTHQALAEIAKRFYIRRSARTLESDLAVLKQPAVIVVDSAQKLPTSIQNRRESLDSWVLRLEALKQKGHTVVLLSEKQRSTYGRADISGYKETSEIEYTADFGVQLIGEPDDPSAPVEFHVVKNRHRVKRGHIISLKRVRGWWFEETDCASDEFDD